MFNPRFTKPSKGNYFYNKPQNGAIYGKPTQDGLNVLSNCVGYANGRFNEIIGEFKYQLVSNAGSFKKYYVDSKYKLEISNTPTLGGIMVWKSSGAGHVAIVEEVSIDKKTIITSESAYGGTPFYTTKRTNKNGRWGMSEAYEFIGCIVNPYVRDNSSVRDDEHEEIKFIDYKIVKGDTLTKIGKKYNKSWQDIYLDNKDIIDSVAKKHGKTTRYFDWIYPDTIIKIRLDN